MAKQDTFSLISSKISLKMWLLFIVIWKIHKCLFVSLMMESLWEEDSCWNRCKLQKSKLKSTKNRPHSTMNTSSIHETVDQQFKVSCRLRLRDQFVSYICYICMHTVWDCCKQKLYYSKLLSSNETKHFTNLKTKKFPRNTLSDILGGNSIQIKPLQINSDIYIF